LTLLNDETLKTSLEATPAARVTEKQVSDTVSNVRFVVDGVLTLAVVTLKNGYKVVGTASPASPENFNKDIGETYAMKDALRQVWPLESYLLCQRLHEGKGLAA
jgi:hypothetical protein